MSPIPDDADRRDATLSRRRLLAAGLAGTVAPGALVGASACGGSKAQEAPAEERRERLPNPISLAQWSLHRTIRAGDLDPMDFPRYTREAFGLDAVEYVNSFYRDVRGRTDAFRTLRRRCEDVGVRSLLIMVDGEGALGDADEARRARAIENHRPWLEAARILGCHAIRVNAQSSGSREEQEKRAADGLARLAAIADEMALDVLVENHGGLSSDGAWLASVMRRVGAANLGTLPDFGNFRVSSSVEYDRYQGVEELMPFARAVSAKSRAFWPDGRESETNFARMMMIIRGEGVDYGGYIGIEWEGSTPDEPTGIRLTRDHLVALGCIARG